MSDDLIDKLVQFPGLRRGRDPVMDKFIADYGHMFEKHELIDAYQHMLTTAPHTRKDAVSPNSIYLSGPMADRPNHNRELFERAAECLRKIYPDMPIVSPVEIGAEWTNNHKLAHPSGDFIRHDVRELSQCSGIAMLPEWMTSRGSRIEAALAGVMGLTFYEVIEFEPNSFSLQRFTPPRILPIDLRCYTGESDRKEIEALDMVLAERTMQENKWGPQDHDPITWLAILTEEVGEFAEASLGHRFQGESRHHITEKIVQAAAVGLATTAAMLRKLWRFSVPIYPAQINTEETQSYCRGEEMSARGVVHGLDTSSGRDKHVETELHSGNFQQRPVPDHPCAFPGCRMGASTPRSYCRHHADRRIPPMRGTEGDPR